MSKGADDFRKAYNDRSISAEHHNCAEFVVEQDGPELDRAYPNGIDRLSIIRDKQRERLQSFYEDRFETTSPVEHVIVLDLDLHRTPMASDVVRAVQYLDGDGSSADAICANGLTMDGKLPYDSYATVLLPDTFLGYFLRSNPTLMPNESSSVIDAYIEATTKPTSTGSTTNNFLPVKSCFGGMAIYRADAWFANECKYFADYTKDHVKYIAAATDRVCEHVAFNHCLQSKYKNDFSIAVHRGLIAKYHEAEDAITPTGRDLKSRHHQDLSFSNAVHPATKAATVGNPYAEKYGLFKPPNPYAEKYGLNNPYAKKYGDGNPYAKKYGPPGFFG